MSFTAIKNDWLKYYKPVIALSSVLLVTGCGGVGSDDGNNVNNVQLPIDSALTLYCAGAGIASEPCILNDPENPYAITPVNDDTKWDLSNAAPSAKARFYLWATAQAISPTGENQFFVAEALQGMYGESGSELARNQALKAYRSVLDNYFYSVTFFECDYAGCPDDDLFYPFPIRKLSGANMHSPAAPLTLLFDNANEMFELVGEWGYTYDAYHVTGNPTGSNDFTINN